MVWLILTLKMKATLSSSLFLLLLVLMLAPNPLPAQFAMLIGEPDFVPEEVDFRERLTYMTSKKGKLAGKRLLNRVESFDTVGRAGTLQLIQDKFYWEGALFSFTKLEYDAQGSPEKQVMIDIKKGKTTTLLLVNTYDSTGRLVKVERSQPGGVNRMTITTVYGPEGTRIESTKYAGNLQEERSYDAAGRLVADYSPGIGSSNAYAYDEKGNLTYSRTAYQEEGHEVYHFTNEYDTTGRLLAVRSGGKLRKQFHYDPDGRVSKFEYFDVRGKLDTVFEFEYKAF